jgi:hypothetical protein
MHVSQILHIERPSNLAYLLCTDCFKTDMYGSIAQLELNLIVEEQNPNYLNFVILLFLDHNLVILFIIRIHCFGQYTGT